MNKTPTLTMTRWITATLTLGKFTIIAIELNREKDNYTDAIRLTDDCDKEKSLVTVRTAL